MNVYEILQISYEANRHSQHAHSPILSSLPSLRTLNLDGLDISSAKLKSVFLDNPTARIVSLRASQMQSTDLDFLPHTVEELCIRWVVTFGTPRRWGEKNESGLEVQKKR